MTKLEYWIGKAEQDLNFYLQNPLRAPSTTIYVCHNGGTCHKEDKQIMEAIIDKVIKPKNLEYKIVPSKLFPGDEFLMVIFGESRFLKNF